MLIVVSLPFTFITSSPLFGKILLLGLIILFVITDFGSVGTQTLSISLKKLSISSYVLKSYTGSSS